MSALTNGRVTKEAIGDIHVYPVAAAVKCFAGGLAVLDAAGNAKPGITAIGLKAVGRFEATVDNLTGAAAAVAVNVKAGTFRFLNSAGGDEITKAEIGDNCFIVDDQTVAKTDGGATRSIAGRITDIQATGVWVSLGQTVTNAPAGALVAANNLSDLGTLGTARANLGVAEAFGAPTITIGAEAVNAINVGIQLKDSAGANLAVRGSVQVYLSDDANGDSLAVTAPSGGWTIGVDGLLIPLVANKAALVVSEATGAIDITITEVGADTWYPIIVMPNGTLVAGGAITFV